MPRLQKFLVNIFQVLHLLDLSLLLIPAKQFEFMKMQLGFFFIRNELFFNIKNKKKIVGLRDFLDAVFCMGLGKGLTDQIFYERCFASHVFFFGW